MKLLLCHDETGRIVNTVTTYPADLPAQYADMGVAFVEHETDLGAFAVSTTLHVVDGAVVARPTFDVADEVEIAANGVDGLTIAIPDPCAVRIDGVEQAITGGELVIQSDMPATYRLELVQWPYIDKTVVIHAVA